MKEYLLFDLDGTLTDPKVGITTCVQYALKAFGIDEPDLDKLVPFIGPPLKNSFMEFYNFSEEDAEKAVAKYRERFSEIGIFENQVYAGIPQMLRSLQSCGMYLAIASSKPTEYVERILEHFDLRKYFKVVVGSEMNGTRVDKEEILMEALRQLFSYKPINYSKVYMIGDRKYDVEGAKKIGVECIGVSYGYGSIEELKAAKADYIVRGVEELQGLLMREGEALKQSRDTKQQAQSQPQKPRGFFQMLWPMLYPLLMFVLVKSVAGNLLFSMLQMLGASMHGTLGKLLFIYDDSGALTGLTGNTSAVLNAVIFIIGVLLLLKPAKQLITKTRQEEKLKHLKPESVKSYVIFGLSTLGIVFGLNIFLELVQITDKVEAYKLFAEDPYSANLFFGILCTCIIIPVTEELVFRGIIYNVARKTYKIQHALLMSALLYGLSHMDSVQGAYGFMMGYIMAYAYEYFGSFLAPVLIHVASSIIVYIITYTGLVNTGLYSWPVCILFLIVALVAMNLVTREKKIL